MIGHACFLLSPDGAVSGWSVTAERLYGYSAERMLNRPFSLLFGEDENAAEVPAGLLEKARAGASVHGEHWYVRQDGSRFWGEDTVSALANAEGGVVGFAHVVSDTSTHRQRLSDSRQTERQLRSLVASVPEYAIFSLRADGIIEDWIAAANTTLGYAKAELVGKHYSLLFTGDDRVNTVPDILLSRLRHDGRLEEERWFVRKDGSRFIGSETISSFDAGADGAFGFVVVARDLTDRDRQAEWRRQALRDPLTNLPNRSALNAHLVRAIAAMKRRPGELFAVMFIDVDHFKRINDRFGHVTGDVLLEVTARRLEKCLRSEDIVARIGGDEFVVLLNGIEDGADAHDAAQRIKEQMRMPVVAGGQSVHATVSIGIALGNSRYGLPDEILRDADIAMYAAKAGGRGRAEIFEPESNIMLRRLGRNLEVDLRHAIERGELRVVYQPVVYLADSSLWGFEALVRWQHPHLGALNPTQFIPTAEQSGLIGSIDRWVLREACSTFAGWRSRYGAQALTLSVNMSGRDFSYAAALEHLTDVLRTTGMPPQRLHIEITESAIMDQSAVTMQMLHAFRRLGVELLIDDFGVGVSSLAALARMPVHGFKLDRAFVAELNAPRGAVLVQAIAKLARDLELSLIAEGIEQPSHVTALTAVGCEIGQGFLFSEPLESVAAGELVCAGRSRRHGS